MKTIIEFMTKVQSYFGGFQNDAVAEMVAGELRYIKPSDYDVLFRQMAMDLPASWKPDYKSLIEAVKKCKIEQLNEPGVERKCPVCGSINTSTGLCPTCCYRPETDGTPAEHLMWWNNWKAGLEPRFDVQSIISGLASNKGGKE